MLTIIGGGKMAEFVKAKTRLNLSPGDSVRIAREILGLSQNELAKKTKIPQSTISGIESDRISLGVHPAVLLFPDWKVGKSSVA
jgi:ribosome-binding protein aMBF1 (putative translation factor)